MSFARGLRLVPSCAALVALVVAPLPSVAADAPATDVYLAGVSSSLMRTRGGDRDTQLGAIGLSASHVGFGYEKPLTIRVLNTGSLAGSAHGVQGGVGTAVAGGLRAPIGDHHGIVLRGGVEGWFFGNQYLWDSLVELPQMHVGYQWLVPRSVADFALKGGYVFAGHHDTGDTTVRDLGHALEWGAIGALQHGPVDLHASYTHVLARGAGRAVDLLDGTFCGIGLPFALCTTVRYELGDGVLPDGSLRATRVMFVGLTIGIVIPDKL